MTIHNRGLRSVGLPWSSPTLGQTAFWTAMACLSPIVALPAAAQVTTPIESAPSVMPIAAVADTGPKPIATTRMPESTSENTTPSPLPLPSNRLSDAAAVVSLRAFLADRRVNTGTEARQLFEADQDAAATPTQPDPQADATTGETVGSLADSGAESLRQQLLIKPLAVGRKVSYAPGSTAGGPTAFGADFGDAYSGLAFSNRRPTNDTADAAFSTGFGLGDARRTVGLEVNVSSGSIAKFGSNGDLGLKLHRNLPGNAAIAVGFDSGITWGKANRDTVSTVYGVATKVFQLNPKNAVNKMPLTVSLGIGGGRFRSYNTLDAGGNNLGVFGSLGLQVAPQASVVSTWTGRDLNLGMSFVPVKSMPIFVTAAAANVLRNHDNNTLFTLSVGVGFNYSNAFR
jgi:hypothetical protein